MSAAIAGFQPIFGAYESQLNLKEFIAIARLSEN